MNTFKLSNIPLEDFRRYLRSKGYEQEPSKAGSGHEKWIKRGMDRPITIQTHMCPIPEFIIKNCLRNIGITRKQFKDEFTKVKY